MARDSSWTWKDALEFISNKFDDFELDRLEKEKNIENLKEEVIYLMRKVDKITVETDRQ